MSIISGQAYNLSTFDMSQNWNAKTESFKTLEGRTKFQNAIISHYLTRFPRAPGKDLSPALVKSEVIGPRGTVLVRTSRNWSE